MTHKEFIEQWAGILSGRMNDPIIPADEVMHHLSTCYNITISPEEAEEILREISVIKEQERKVMSIFDRNPLEENE